MVAGRRHEGFDKVPGCLIMDQVMAQQAGRLGGIDGLGAPRRQMIDGEAEGGVFADEAAGSRRSTCRRS